MEKKQKMDKTTYKMRHQFLSIFSILVRACLDEKSLGKPKKKQTVETYLHFLLELDFARCCLWYLVLTKYNKAAIFQTGSLFCRVYLVLLSYIAHCYGKYLL